jgi:hypothetical protein
LGKRRYEAPQILIYIKAQAISRDILLNYAAAHRRGEVLRYGRSDRDKENSTGSGMRFHWRGDIHVACVGGRYRDGCEGGHGTGFQGWRGRPSLGKG